MLSVAGGRLRTVVLLVAGAVRTDAEFFLRVRKIRGRRIDSVDDPMRETVGQRRVGVMADDRQFFRACRDAADRKLGQYVALVAGMFVAQFPERFEIHRRDLEVLDIQGHGILPSPISIELDTGLEVGDGFAPDALMHARAGCDGDTDQKLVRARAVRHAECDGIIVRADIKLVLVGERDIDGCAGGGDLADRRDPSLAAPHLLPQRVSEHRGDASDDMFLFARRTRDTALAVAFNRPVAEQRDGSLTERMTDSRTRIRQLG